jgi:type I restriction enzyme S subunit
MDSHVTLVRAAPAEINQNYLALTLMERQRDLERLGHGSTGQTELSRSRLGEMPILVPPWKEQEALSDFYAPIREQIGLLQRQVTTLLGIRDALLPKLISDGPPLDPGE